MQLMPEEQAVTTCSCFACPTPASCDSHSGWPAWAVQIPGKHRADTGPQHTWPPPDHIHTASNAVWLCWLNPVHMKHSAP